jgi:hypothetical protein
MVTEILVLRPASQQTTQRSLQLSFFAEISYNFGGNFTGSYLNAASPRLRSCVGQVAAKGLQISHNGLEFF